MVLNEIVHSFESRWGGGGSEQSPQNPQFYWKRGGKWLCLSQRAIQSCPPNRKEKYMMYSYRFWTLCSVYHSLARLKLRKWKLSTREGQRWWLTKRFTNHSQSLAPSWSCEMDKRCVPSLTFGPAFFCICFKESILITSQSWREPPLLPAPHHHLWALPRCKWKILKKLTALRKISSGLLPPFSLISPLILRQNGRTDSAFCSAG